MEALCLSAFLDMNSRLPTVDLLRTLSILFVLLNHVNVRLRLAKVPYTAGLPDLLTRTLVWNGQHGVQIFFAVSGFLITTTALRRWGTLQNLQLSSFYQLRFARIAPLLLLLLAILSTLHLAGVKNFVIHPKQGGLPAALLAALTFQSNVLEAQRGYLPGSWDILWSLSVEEMFYLFFPLAARFLRPLALFLALLAVLMIAGPWTRTHTTGLWQEYSYLGGMDAIAMGCCTALFVDRIRIAPALLTAIGAILMAIPLCLRIKFDDTVLALGTCCVLAAAPRLTWRPSRLAALLLSLGQNSYEIYLTHMFIVFALFEIFLRLGKPLPAVPVFFGGTILLSALLGAAVARFYATPLNTMLRKI